MSLLSLGFLETVVSIGAVDVEALMHTNTPKMNQTATGFLYSYPDGGRVWFVTCKHVIQPLRLLPGGVIARMNRERGMELGRLNSENVKWQEHPKADIAVVSTNWKHFEERGIRWKIFASVSAEFAAEFAADGKEANVLKRADFAKANVWEGSDVFMLGFPTGWREGRQDYPIVRHGMIAQIQGYLNGDHDTFLVDGSGFKGHSGGPIITKPDRFNPTKSFLVGMVSERRCAPITPEEMGLRETADLIEVVPVDLIDETIDLAMKHETKTKEKTQ